ncbi:MAG: lipoprotein-releasing ABC transporter permease subunit [Deltaproteobacteria bacterium]|jgi:lipoprotein-releasing system permease protein|nr:lipoprotein-releasing ABC transporter permease subunit [Deltaproteobacteria bacterium]
MSFEFFVALRYLLARKGQAFISIISWISIAGVALGVASLIVVMGVMNGFTTDLRDKIIGATAHAILFSVNPLFEDEKLLAEISATPGLTGVTPFIYSELMISSPAGVKGVVLRGIDPATAAPVLGALQTLEEGALEELAAEDGLPGILVGKDLAGYLSLYPGSRVTLLSPSGQRSSAGFSPRLKSFRVTGIFSTGLYQYDSSLVFVNLKAARETLGWPDGRISGLELAVRDVYAADAVADEVIARSGPERFYAKTWMTMNSNLFAALSLEKAAMAVILTLVVLIGSFSIVTALVMLVMEKTRDIAVLMSLGATRRSIRRLFILQGMIIGLTGTGLGALLGIGASLLLGEYKIIELPPGVYSLDYMPVLLHTSDIVLTVICALILCFLATLSPARQASRLEPVDALRQE